MPKHRWRPLPRNGSTKGDHTIRVAGLDRPGLLDLFDRHVSDHIEPIATRLWAEMATGNGPGIAAIWSNDAVKWLKPGRPFTALSYDALDHYIPLAEQRRWGLPYEDHFETFAVYTRSSYPTAKAGGLGSSLGRNSGASRFGFNDSYHRSVRIRAKPAQPSLPAVGVLSDRPGRG